jgi:undecaprenyl pyrophosphate phosphatase UppP
MDRVVPFTSLIMAVVAALSEFPPVSSTGYRIVTYLLIAALLVLGVVAWTG